MNPDPGDEIAAGTETGWWNEAGTPAPWPENFPENWRPETHHATTTEHEQPAF